jgi:DNA-binding CsgD family transcriptional regulator
VQAGSKMLPERLQNALSDGRKICDKALSCLEELGRRRMTRTDAETKPIDRLTEGQKDCLRLVKLHLSSKEIARELGISPHTVDQRLKRATAILASSTRFEAARLLSDEEGSAFFDPRATIQAKYQSLVHQSPDLSSRDDSADQQASANGISPNADTVGAMLHETQASYFSGSKSQRQPQSFWLDLFEEKRENKLTTQSRILVMVLMMVFSLLGFAILVSVLEGLSRLY